jgi:uncharacterized 2Fe-2S/4Fe-4S cluster protein (DUF4445 family)
MEMDRRNVVVEISKESCEETANRLFAENSGISRGGKKRERIKENAEKIRSLIDERISPKAVYSYFPKVELDGKEATIEDHVFTCHAFEQIDPKKVKGAYVYVITAGDFALEDSPIMDQLLADIWGTAFTDAAREQLQSKLSEEEFLSNGFGPGFYGMDVKQMADIAGLVDPEKIGVQVRSSSILVPLKSCAGIFFVMDEEFQLVSLECEDCRGTVTSCSLCNIKRAQEGREMQKEKKKEDKAVFRCTGICSQCGRCKNAGMIAGANKRKTKLLTLPADFVPDKGDQGYGVAFDVGTTTVVGMLVDLYTGEHLSSLAKTNPQNKHGLDVISRITFSHEKEGNLALLRNDIVACLNEIIDELCKENDLPNEAVVRVTFCGNTTMSHIFAGYDPISLAFAPFAPAYTGTLMFKGNELDLRMSEDGDVMVFPNIAGHVGGDITSGILATRFLDKKDLTIFIDIGTNGEIALTDGKTVLACSTAAGPAFEGSAIYQGMRAAPGAIEKIQIKEDKVLFRTIDDVVPVGICGSGLIDAIAQMIEAGIIKKTGRLATPKDFAQKNPEIGDRLRERDGMREFVLVYKEEGEDIVITQKDVREVQLAKGAISAGISIMLEQLNAGMEDLNEVIVAGAFGSFIDKESAMTIGLLPKVDSDDITSAGNTAGAGTLMAVTNAGEAVKAKEIPGRVEHVELASTKDFQEKYVAAMAF